MPIYGITLRSNQKLPILAPASTTATADVEVNLAEGDLSALSHQDNEYPSGWQTQQKADGIYYRLSLRGIGETLDMEIASTGKQIWITRTNMPLEEVTAILLGCVLGTALRLLGLVCLHSSVIAVNNRAICLWRQRFAIAIIGVKGAGKSTTAAALAKRGYPILSDDVAVLSNCGTCRVQPGYPRLRLCPRAVNALYGSEVGVSRVFRQTDKHFVELNPDGAEAWRFHSEPRTLAAIYILGNRQPELAAATIEPISPQIGLMHLLTHRYPQSLKLVRDRQAQEFAMLGSLVTRVPMRQLNRPDSLDALPQLCDAILADVARL